MPPFIAIILLSALFTASPGQVHAATSQAICTSYAKDAVTKAKEARKLECGFAGPAWVTDEWVHLNWCVSAKDESVENEKSKRAAWFKACKNCREYGNAAAHYGKLSLKFQCGFTGPRWQADASAHFQWCMHLSDRSDRGPLGTEEAARADQFQSCSECHRYADEAASAARTNIDRGCGLTGSRWITDAQAHFGWCMQSGSGPATSETNARRADLANCGPREFPKTTTPPPKATSCPDNMFLGQDGTCYPILR